MSFHLNLPPPPGDLPSSLKLYLEHERQLLLDLIRQLNRPGCGLYFDVLGQLAVKVDGITVICGDQGLTALVTVVLPPTTATPIGTSLMAAAA